MERICMIETIIIRVTDIIVYQLGTIITWIRISGFGEYLIAYFAMPTGFIKTSRVTSCNVLDPACATYHPKDTNAQSPHHQRHIQTTSLTCAPNKGYTYTVYSLVVLLLKKQ